MTRKAQWLYGWLLLLPAAALLALFTHYPAIATAWDSSLFDTQRRAPCALRRPRQLPAARRGPDLLAGVHEQRLVCARHDSSVDRACIVDGDMGEPEDRRARIPAPRVFHADDPADDRGRQHLALLLHARVRAARAAPRPLRRAVAQLARQQEHRAAGADGGDRLEGSRIFHDLLPGGAAGDVAEPCRSRGDRGRVALVFLPPRHVSAADADDTVRARQRGDQRVPDGRPRRRHDAGRAGQRHCAAALLHLQVGFRF